MDYIIDWLGFTIKPDHKSDKFFEITIDDIYSILGFNSVERSSFVLLPSNKHYDYRYSYNNINIYVPRSTEYAVMGFFVEMSGDGCRYFEKKNGRDCYIKLFKTLRQYVENGCSLNFPRIDFAFDDFDGLLCMEEIHRCVRNREYVSLFRCNDRITEYECLQVLHRTSSSKSTTGDTFYFGNRKSNTFCRFYDKLAEQKIRKKNNPQALEELQEISHWVRCEFVFRNSVANRIVASMLELELDDFSDYLAELINTYLRFVDIEGDSNVTRMKIKSWWAEFIGTVERSSIKCVGIPQNPLQGALYWLQKSCAPTLNAIMAKIGQDRFLDLINSESVIDRFKGKHYDIMSSENCDEVIYSNSQLWDALVPVDVLERIKARRKQESS